MTISGIRITHIMSSTRLRMTLNLAEFGPGEFGWIETHVHAKIVAKQLHRISQVERSGGQLQGALLDIEMDSAKCRRASSMGDDPKPVGWARIVFCNAEQSRSNRAPIFVTF